ncbi:MAG: polysaccharide pyruvyl transferase family protein [Planctomycetota bacterium]
MELYEITGAGTHNKGAFLMLKTVIRRLSSGAAGDIRFGVDPYHAGDYYLRALEGLYQLAPSWNGNSQFNQRWKTFRSRLVYKLISKRYRDALGLVHRDRCRGLIDISGLKYSDLFPLDSSTNAIGLIDAYYKKRGAPVVFLPQMVGPFSGQHSDAFRRLFERADLFYVRDSVSLTHARALVGNSDKLRQAPDITIFSDDATDETPASARRRVCMIPNSKVIVKGAATADAYREQFARVAQRVASSMFELSIVVHDASAADNALVEDILQLPDIIAAKPAVIRSDDPVILKRYIAASRFIVSSRYHSIVAALSCGVPAIALGWAHKYETLLDEFGVKELNGSPSAPASALDETLDALLDDARLTALSDTIHNRKEAMAATSDAMWDAVRKTLNIVK